MINYKIIQDSIDFYEQQGFTRIESPWTVSPYIDEITRSDERKPFSLEHNGKCLVASGEQSFLYMYLKDSLPKGKFQTVTPCFRDEVVDLYHSKTFIKNELIQTDVISLNELDIVVEAALRFFSTIFEKKDLKVHPTSDGYDIEFKGIELGSYGIRSSKFLEWIFATGCAEPRVSKILQYHGLSY